MNLDEIRKKIDTIDNKILELLKQRFELSLATRKLKSKTEDLDRESQIYRQLQILAKEKYLPEKFVFELFELIITESKKRQNE